MKRYPQYPRVHVATLGSRIRMQLDQGRGMGRERRYSSGMIAGYRLLPAMSCIARTCLSTASASLSRFYTIISTNLRCLHLSLSTLHPPVNTPVLPAAHLHNPYHFPDPQDLESLVIHLKTAHIARRLDPCLEPR
jgi:hypothetical protein